MGLDEGMLLVILVNGMAYLFTYCYFGKMSTESFNRMGESVYEMNWYEFSNDSKKYFLFIIQNAQRPLYYHGLDVAIMNLETFTKVR